MKYHFLPQELELSKENNFKFKFVKSLENKAEIAVYKSDVFQGVVYVDKFFSDFDFNEKEDLNNSQLAFIIFSPDKFSISPDLFLTQDELNEYFQKWKERFKVQGYYSSNEGRIDIDKLDDSCERILVLVNNSNIEEDISEIGAF